MDYVVYFICFLNFVLLIISITLQVFILLILKGKLRYQNKTDAIGKEGKVGFNG